MINIDNSLKACFYIKRVEFINVPKMIDSLKDQTCSPIMTNLTLFDSRYKNGRKNYINQKLFTYAA